MAAREKPMPRNATNRSSTRTGTLTRSPALAWPGGPPHRTLGQRRLDCSKGFRRNGASDHSVEYMSPYLSRERELVTIWGIGPPSCPDGRSGPASSSHLD
jgi:hypothetical protein